MFSLAAVEPKITQYDSKDNIFVKQKEFQLENIPVNDWNTIQATTDHVFLFDRNANVIRKYTAHGQLIMTYGKFGTNLGEFSSGHLSGSDAFGNVLIAGNGNRRLDVLKANGTVQRLPVNGIGQNSLCFRVHKDKLYIVLFSAGFQVFSVA